MFQRRSLLPGATTLAIGMVLGWAFTHVQPSRLHADSGDRWGNSVLACGMIKMENDEKGRVQVLCDALYYLDYAGVRLMANVPTHQKTGGRTRILNEWAVRDLMADFKIPRNVVPHFLMTVASLGAHGDGMAPVFVLETTTKMIASYQVQDVRNGASTRPLFDLIEIQPIPPSSLPPVTR